MQAVAGPVPSDSCKGVFQAYGGQSWGTVAGTAAWSRLPATHPNHSVACSTTPVLSSCFLLNLRRKHFGKLELRTLTRALSSNSS